MTIRENDSLSPAGRGWGVRRVLTLKQSCRRRSPALQLSPRRGERAGGVRAFSISVPAPQRPLEILQEHALQLLPAEPCAGVHLLHGGAEIGGEVGVVGGCAPGRQTALHGEDAAQQRERPGRRRDERARAGAEAQAEHQIVPGVVRIGPFRQLVAPGEMMLRAAQFLGAHGGEGMGLRARGETEDAAAGDPARALVAAGAGEEAALALHHHPGDLVEAGGDEGDAGLRMLAGAVPDPLRPGPGLAEAAAGDDRPDPPGEGVRIALRRLSLMGAERPFLAKCPDRRRRQLPEHPPQLGPPAPRQIVQHRALPGRGHPRHFPSSPGPASPAPGETIPRRSP